MKLHVWWYKFCQICTAHLKGNIWFFVKQELYFYHYGQMKNMFVWKHFSLRFGWCSVFNINFLCQSYVCLSDELRYLWCFLEMMTDVFGLPYRTSSVAPVCAKIYSPVCPYLHFSPVTHWSLTFKMQCKVGCHYGGCSSGARAIIHLSDGWWFDPSWYCAINMGVCVNY